MTSARKIAANQANAKVSPGPRTARGKSKASQNARRHGLSLSVSADAIRAEQADQLAHEIVRKGAAPEILEPARHFAQAEVDLMRIHQVRHELFERHFQAGELDGRMNEFAVKLVSLIKELTLIDRYERRALSRRKFAIRKLGAAGLQETK